MNDPEPPTNPHTGQPLPDDALGAIERPVSESAPHVPPAETRAPAQGTPEPPEVRGPAPAPPSVGAGSAFEADAAATPASPAGGAASGTGGTAGATQPAPSQQEMAVRSALETVMDPEIGLSVIDLGLIREIHFLADKTFVRMMLTTPFCPYAPQLMADVKTATMSVVPLPCEVEIMPDAWSPDLMPDPGLLGFSF
jgi:metal-sulfur cluster biosynthetic enzyme